MLKLKIAQQIIILPPYLANAFVAVMKRKWIIFIAGGLLISAAAVTLYEGIRPLLRPTTKSVGPATADTDGFEVVVYKSDGNPIAQSLELPAARKLIEANPTATFLLPQKQIESIQAALQKSENTNSGASPVTVSATELEPGREDITLSFHYANRTLSYKYEATVHSVSPYTSGEDSLAGEKRTTYR